MTMETNFNIPGSMGKEDDLSLIDGRYQITAHLGSGTSGVVYAGRDLELSSLPVAIKLLYPHLMGDHEALEQFKLEVLITQKLSHPCIVQTYRFIQTDDEQICLVMELVEGKPLSETLQRFSRGLPLDKLIAILYAVACGLEYAHEKGVLHRDLKPDNILILPDDSPKIADFGLAQSSMYSNAEDSDNKPAGTPYYMAPEIFNGVSSGAKADIYAFGVTAYQLATGSLPFTAPSLLLLAEAHENQPLPEINSTFELPTELNHLIKSCCDKNPFLRPSIREVTDCLQTIILRHIKESEPYLLLRISAESHKASDLENLEDTKAIRSRPFLLLTRLLALVLFLGFFVTPRVFRSMQWRTAIVIAYAEKYTDLDLSFVYRMSGIKEDMHDPRSLESASKANILVPIVSGVDPNFLGSDGLYPISRVIALPWTREMKQYAIELYIAHGADTNKTDKEGNNSLLTAIGLEDPDILEILLTAGAKVNFQNNQGVTPLMLSVSANHLANTIVLLRHGADPKLRNLRGVSALHLAAQNCNELILKLLKKAATWEEDEKPAWERELAAELKFCEP